MKSSKQCACKFSLYPLARESGTLFQLNILKLMTSPSVLRFTKREKPWTRDGVEKLLNMWKENPLPVWVLVATPSTFAGLIWASVDSDNFLKVCYYVEDQKQDDIIMLEALCRIGETMCNNISRNKEIYPGVTEESVIRYIGLDTNKELQRLEFCFEPERKRLTDGYSEWRISLSRFTKDYVANVYEKIKKLHIYGPQSDKPVLPAASSVDTVRHDNEDKVIGNPYEIKLTCPERVESGNPNKFLAEIENCDAEQLFRDGRLLYFVISIYSVADNRLIKLRNEKDNIPVLVKGNKTELNVRLLENPQEKVYACCRLYEGITLLGHVDSSGIECPSTTKRTKKNRNQPRKRPKQTKVNVTSPPEPMPNFPSSLHHMPGYIPIAPAPSPLEHQLVNSSPFTPDSLSVPELMINPSITPTQQSNTWTSESGYGQTHDFYSNIAEISEHNSFLQELLGISQDPEKEFNDLFGKLEQDKYNEN